MWLVTAGPTREYLDDVRFLTNASSGRMGYAIAAAAAARGHEVVLVSGPVALEAPAGVEVLAVETAREMLDTGRLLLEVRSCSCLFGVAAVCDYRPAERLAGKPAKGRGQHSLDLVENPDVIANLAALAIADVAVGFALEDLSGGLEPAHARAVTKLEAKRLQAIVLNPIAAIEADESEAWWVTATDCVRLGRHGKPALAELLVDRVEATQRR